GQLEAPGFIAWLRSQSRQLGVELLCHASRVCFDRFAALEHDLAVYHDRLDQLWSASPDGQIDRIVPGGRERGRESVAVENDQIGRATRFQYAKVVSSESCPGPSLR